MLHETTYPVKNRKRITWLVTIFGGGMILLAFLVTPAVDVFRGEWAIITSPSILITDYIAYANLGAAFLNAGLVTLIGLGLAWLIRARFNGYLISAIFTLQALLSSERMCSISCRFLQGSIFLTKCFRTSG